MAKRDVVVVGASAGGVDALRTLVAGLPADFPAVVLVVLHLPPTLSSALPSILRRGGVIDVGEAFPDAKLTPGRVLVAPPNHHLIVYGDKVTLSRGPRENGHRPAIDVLFRSAARALGPRVTAVVLSGTLDDGTAGMVAVRSQGGLGLVQDPLEALHDSMPRCAIEGAEPDHVLSVADMPALLGQLAREEVTPGARILAPEPEPAAVPLPAQRRDSSEQAERPTGVTCPECGGALFEIREGPLVRFGCGVGHAWSPESLMVQQSSALEGALWMALRSLEERAALTHEMGGRARNRGHGISASAFQEESQEATAAALLVRDLITRMSSAGWELSERRSAEPNLT